MHIVIVNCVYDPEPGSVAVLLERYTSLTGWAESLLAAGADRVTVVQRFRHDVELRRGGLRYVFCADGGAPIPHVWSIPARLLRRVAKLQPDVVHVNGMLFPVQVRMLRHVLPRHAALVVQHHGEQPWHAARGQVQRWGLGAPDGFLFAARDLAQPWIARGMIRLSQAVYQVMESSTRFGPQPRAAARAITGMQGDPVLLWVGRLDGNKDPLTVLEGVDQALARLPNARLYMAYGSDTLLPQVRERIARSARLRRAVTLLGRLPQPAMEHYYNSADYFLLGSHREGSGYALIEALACGVVPIVTAIPSFRVITDHGRIGALWPAGNATALGEAIGEVVSRPLEAQAAAAQQFFAEHLSFTAIGGQAIAAYREIIARREVRTGRQDGVTRCGSP